MFKYGIIIKAMNRGFFTAAFIFAAAAVLAALGCARTDAAAAYAHAAVYAAAPVAAQTAAPAQKCCSDLYITIDKEPVQPRELPPADGAATGFFAEFVPEKFFTGLPQDKFFIRYQWESGGLELLYTADTSDEESAGMCILSAELMSLGGPAVPVFTLPLPKNTPVSILLSTAANGWEYLVECSGQPYSGKIDFSAEELLSQQQAELKFVLEVPNVTPLNLSSVKIVRAGYNAAAQQSGGGENTEDEDPEDKQPDDRKSISAGTLAALYGAAGLAAAALVLARGQRAKLRSKQRFDE